MITPVFLVALAAFQALPTMADPGPLEPSPGSVYNAGSGCLIKWNADTTGVWKQMNIELKTGSDDSQVDVTCKLQTNSFGNYVILILIFVHQLLLLWTVLIRTTHPIPGRALR